MNRIDQTFTRLKENNEKALIAFITGGYPDIQTTEQLILTIIEAGADLIEIGIPFSDPVAEGPVIQEASEGALAAGCTVDLLFDMVKRVRQHSDIPLLFMTYANPVYVYGKERFMKRCNEVGIDGVIIPDVPFEEKDEFIDSCQDHEIHMIPLIAPTSGERARHIVMEATGFLYCVSSLGVTGVRDVLQTNVAPLIQHIRSVSDIPCAIGFGISNAEQARSMASHADGVIIGSAIVTLVLKYKQDCFEPVRQFIMDVKRAIS